MRFPSVGLALAYLAVSAVSFWLGHAVPSLRRPSFLPGVTSPGVRATPPPILPSSSLANGGAVHSPPSFPSPSALSLWCSGVPRPRYLRLSNDPVGEFLQAVELEAVLASGENVARGKPCSASSVYEPDFGCDKLVDGVREARGGRGFFHSGGQAAGEFAEIDLGAEAAVVSVSVFNRDDAAWNRLERHVLELLDGHRRTIAVFALRGERGEQRFDTTQLKCPSHSQSGASTRSSSPSFTATRTASLSTGASPIAVQRIQLADGLLVPVDAARELQAALDCWLRPGLGGKSLWTGSHPNGWLYPPGAFLGHEVQSCGHGTLAWEPSGACAAAGWAVWPAFDAQRAAALLRRFGGIFFVGDSISQQHYQSLLSAVPNSSDVRVEGRQTGGMSARGLLGGAVPTYFARNDRLFWETEAHSWTEGGGELQDFWLEAWSEELSSGPYRTIVLNRGAHYVPDALFLAELNATMAMIPRRFLTIYRTTIPGSLHCQRETQPYANLSQVPPATKWPYNWDKFAHQNKLARRLFQEHYPHVLVIDPVDALLLRPETRVSSGLSSPERQARKDCLHWCMPGPGDLMTVALIELLAAINALPL